MTDRRTGDDLEHAPDARRGRAPRERPGSPGEQAILALQESAGNRAVADLIGEGQAPQAAATRATESNGLVVRDRLRAGSQPTRATVQRQGGMTLSDLLAKLLKAFQGGPGPVEKEGGPGPVKEPTTAVKGGAGGGRMLAVGSSGPAVAQCQELLTAAGFTVTSDGVFGPRTRAAVVAFQSSRGLDPDGIVGPLTWGALEASSPASKTATSVGQPSTGEMELVEPGPAMEKTGSAGGEVGPMIQEPQAWKTYGAPGAGVFPEEEIPEKGV
jgi:hypothetical protein